ncbi:Glutathione S-transferase GstB [Serratia rubidaea]|uniref:Glutathione S-transferase GstB n=1 Tax=Serratia rubidaea TaxID=61652 RepID=A0A3S4FQY2_SERRU|nr:Glutathione S-transferase GstB [Serratia rubidaea]
MLEVWGRKSSSNVQALMWCIGELGLPYQRHDVGHRFGGTDSDEFYALNPNRTIPVLQDGDLPPLWETGAILRYLANRYAPDEFWPADLIARTHVDRWMEWSKLNVALLFTAPIFWRVVRTPAAERDPAALGQALQAFENKLMIAEPLLAGQTFLAGDTFSAADIQFGHVLYRYYDIDIDRQPLPNLRSYYDRLTERPAFREHVMVSYEELRA